MNTYKLDREADARSLTDDEFFRLTFNDNLPASPALISALKGENFEAISAKTRHQITRLSSDEPGTVDLFCRGRNSEGRLEDVLIFRIPKGNTDSIPFLVEDYGGDLTVTPPRTLIMLSQEDCSGSGQAVCHNAILRYDYDEQKILGPGTDVYIVNGTYDGDDSIGRLNRSMKAKRPEESEIKEITDTLAHFKGPPEGRKNMSTVIEQIVEQHYSQIREEGRQEGRLENAANTVLVMLRDNTYTLQQILTLSGLPAEHVQAIAKEHGLECPA